MAGIESLMNQIRDAVDNSLQSSANDLLAKAVALAPVEKTQENKLTGKIYREGGVLKQSGFVRPNHYSLDKRRFDVVFDTRIIRPNKQNFNYAIIQHEKQMPHPDGGEWKYLETPYKSSIDEYRIEIANAIQPYISQGGKVILGSEVTVMGTTSTGMSSKIGE